MYITFILTRVIIYYYYLFIVDNEIHCYAIPQKFQCLIAFVTERNG